MNSFPTQTDSHGTSLEDSERLVIPVLAETAQVHLLREHTGTVRVRKVVHETLEPVVAHGYREVVETTRLPVNQVVEAPQASRTVDDVLVIPVYEERLVRQLVLVEEIHVRRRREPFEHTVATALRREEVIVERLNPHTQEWVADGR
jgi:stress response protein YsnF